MKNFVRLLLIIGIFIPSILVAQDVTLKVSTKKQVVVGEKFQVVFELNADGSNFKAPSFEGFNVVGGPFTSSSSSFQVINGSMSQSHTNTYTMALQAYKEGEFTIGSASVTVKGDKVTSNPFSIKVVADNGNAYGGNSQDDQNSQSQQRHGSTDPQVSGKDLFLKVTPSKKSVYLGEQVVLTYKLYTKVGVSSLTVSKMPSYGGAWMKEIGDNNGGTLRQSSEYVNGVEYTTAEIRKVVLVPQRVGKLVIDPMSVECIAQIPTNNNSRRSMDPFDMFFNDPFFGRGFTNVQKELSCSSLGIDVKNLPNEGKPASFAGAVGNYSFKAEIDKTELKTNEAFTLTLTVSGTGNVELLQMPEPVFPPDFEVYDPKVIVDANPSSNGISGTKRQEYLVIPRRVGDFTIAPVEFSFFNPSSGSYSVARSEQFDIHVAKGENDNQDGGSIYASNQEGVKYLGSDIRHIMTGNARLKKTNSFFFASVAYWLIIFLLLVVFLVVMIVSRKQAELRKDEMKNRNKKATKVASKRLKNASKYLKVNDQDHFYEEMSQALWGYISDKMSIERAKLSMETVNDAMRSKNVPEDLTKQFVDTLNNCEFARFAPGNANEKMDGLYQQGMEVITKAEKVL